MTASASSNSELIWVHAGDGAAIGAKHVAQALRTAQFTDQLAYGINSGARRLLCRHVARVQPSGFSDQPQSIGNHWSVELHCMWEHDA